MKARPKIGNGVVVAAGLAFLATVLVTLLASLIGLATVIRITAPLLSLAYLLYLVRSSGVRTGRVVTFAAWAVFAACAWWWAPSLTFYLLLHAGAIWLLRSLYAYSSLVSALADLALSAFAVLAFAWAFSRTGSVFLATWCFFLAQALWVCIPAKLPGRRPVAAPVEDNTGFEQARRQADAALRQLFTQQP